ncbi:MAG TPA: hypothetical protein VNB22_05820 [Pyrinomonadaceae bacterium]|jgi:hypothetical protein|nr:hypothetical protein [Pyrinomonadaceae bacterium]
MGAKSKLIFVYNADSGIFNLLTDIAHKTLSPQTYACNLCAITHSNFGMKKEWKEYLAILDEELEFLHADEFKRKYSFGKVELPAIFREENEGGLILAVDARTINECNSISDLKKSLQPG